MSPKKVVDFATPKIVHQTWKTEELPKAFEENVERWKRLHPNYDFYFYSDDDIEKFIKKRFPQYYEAYSNFEHHIERVDFVRYAILYTYGGIYADMDTIPVKSFDSLIASRKIILSRESLEHVKIIHKGMKDLICNAIMVSPPGENFWIDFMEHIIDNYSKRKDPVYNTGPKALTDFYYSAKGREYTEHGEEVDGDVIVLSACAFNPIVDKTRVDTKNKQSVVVNYPSTPYGNGGPETLTFDNISAECDLRSAYAVHLWSHTWSSMDLTGLKYVTRRLYNYIDSFFDIRFLIIAIILVALLVSLF